MALDADRIRKNERKLEKTLKKARKHPTPEEIHDLRTHTRRLETTLQTLSLDSKHNERQVLKRLGRIRKRAGKVRDMDVLTSDLSSLRIKREKNCLIQLFEYVGVRRYRHAHRLAGSIRRTLPEIRRRLRKTSQRIRKSLGKNGDASAQREPVANAVTSAMDLISEFTKPVNLNRQNLHEFRLKVKELRDVLQMSDTAEHEAFVESMGKVKNAIGEWHDWEELIAISAKILDHGPNCGLLHELRVISSRKYELALFITNKMRKDCQVSSRRIANTRAGGKKGPGPRALKAVPTIAA